MLEALNNPLLQVGAAIGFLVGVAVCAVMGLLSMAFSGEYRGRSRHRDSLIQKLQHNGYTACIPLLMTGQLDLKTPLTHDEERLLSLDRMLVFDCNGQPITTLLPLTNDPEQVAQQRRAEFRVIQGRKPG